MIAQKLVSGYNFTNLVGTDVSWSECRNWCKCSLTLESVN